MPSASFHPLRARLGLPPSILRTSVLHSVARFIWALILSFFVSPVSCLQRTTLSAVTLRLPLLTALGISTRLPFLLPIFAHIATSPRLTLSRRLTHRLLLGLRYHLIVSDLSLRFVAPSLPLSTIQAPSAPFSTHACFASTYSFCQPRNGLSQLDVILLAPRTFTSFRLRAAPLHA